MMNKYRELINNPGFLQYTRNDYSFYRGSKNIYLAPKGCGKSTFLQFLKLYYDEKEDASDLHVYGNGNMNKLHVIYLDFSDFSARSYEEALHYLNLKISELYYSHIDIYDQSYHKSYFINALEGKLSQKKLSSAINVLNDKPYHIKEEPLILIDDFTRPLVYAKLHGYHNAMKTLLESMIDINAYLHNYAIILTGDIPNGKNLDYSLTRYYSFNNPYDLPHAKEIYRRNTDEELLPVQFKQFGNCSLSIRIARSLLSDAKPYTYAIGDDLLVKTKQMRTDLEIQQKKSNKMDLDFIKQEKLDYAYQLPADIPRISSHYGDHAYPIGNDPQHLNDLLRDIYHHVYYIDFVEIYKYMLNYNEDIKTDWKDISSHNLGDYSSSDWAEYSSPLRVRYYQWIKVIVSLKDPTHVARFFNDCLDYLVEHATEGYHAKASKKYRDDNVHFWVTRKDFFPFEEYLKKHQKLMSNDLPFIAYRGKLGITKEYSDRSHNSSFAKIISLYLQHITSEDEISFTSMMDLFVKAWNMELDDTTFEHTSALDLVLLLETADVLTNKTSLHDDHLLLSGNAERFYTLADCENWKQYERKMLRK